MSEKDVWVKRRREEDVFEEGEEEEKGILGCRCSALLPCVGVFTRQTVFHKEGATLAEGKRAAPCNQQCTIPRW